MPAHEIRIVSLAAGHTRTLTSQGQRALAEADVLVHDDTLDSKLSALQRVDSRTILVSASAFATLDELEADLHRVVETIRLGKRLTRVVTDSPQSLRRLQHELRIMRLWGLRYRIIPNREAMEQQAWDLNLPWLLSLRPPQFRIFDSAALQGDLEFWEDLARTDDTLAVDLGRGSLQHLVEQLLMAGADPHKPVALVAHNPAQNPICWLTTLDELDELYLHWKTTAATILYIGSWPRIEPSSLHQPDVWGPLAAAADQWLRTGTLAEHY